MISMQQTLARFLRRTNAVPKGFYNLMHPAAIAALPEHLCFHVFYELNVTVWVDNTGEKSIYRDKNESKFHLEKSKNFSLKQTQKSTSNLIFAVSVLASGREQRLL